MASRNFSRTLVRTQGQRMGRVLSDQFSRKRRTQTGTYLGSSQVRVGGQVYRFRNSADIDVVPGSQISVVNVGRKAHAVYEPAAGGGTVSVGGGGSNGTGGDVGAHGLNEHSDTTLSGLAANDVLLYDGANWRNSQDVAVLSRNNAFGVLQTFENAIDFEEIAEPASPAANTMRMFAVDDSGVTTLETKDADGHVFRVHEDTYRVARNTTGVTINKGEAVYFAGSTGNKPNIALARADSEDTMPAIGLAYDDIADNAFGIVLVIGHFGDIDTSAFAEGAELFVSPTVAGGLTTTLPAHPDLSQSLGTVEVSSVGAGQILLNVAPTLLGTDSGTNRNNFTIGDQTAGAKTLTFDNGNEAVLSWEPTAARTVTIPDETMTLAGRDVANVFTTNQILENNKWLRWKDSGGTERNIMRVDVNDVTTIGGVGLGAGIEIDEPNNAVRIVDNDLAVPTILQADGSVGSVVIRNHIHFVRGGSNHRVLEAVALDNGAGSGNRILLQRNTNASTPAAGYITLFNLGGTGYRIWPDTNGDLRIHTADPINVNDGAGVIVGSQSSWIGLKQNIEPWHAQTKALQTVLDTPLYEFELKADSQLCHDGSKKRRHGLIIEDRTEWFAHNCGPQQVPALDERTLFGHLIASIQTLHGRIETLEAQLGI